MQKQVEVTGEPKQSTLQFSVDVDTDTIVSYDDHINLDTEQVKAASGDSFTLFWQSAVDTYVDESMKDAVRRFLSIPHLRDSYAIGCVSEHIEYPCIVAGDTLWLKACYELSSNSEGHLMAWVLLSDMTLLDAPDDLERI